MNDKGIFSLVIILLSLITLSLENVWIRLGEILCWSLLGLKGLREDYHARTQTTGCPLHAKEHSLSWDAVI